jgi:two-component system OmpR family sensor kinase
MKLSLRARLLTVLVVLLALALAASDVATYKVLRGQLLRGIDQQLLTARRPFERSLSGVRPMPAPDAPAPTRPAEPRLFSDPARLKGLLPSGTYLKATDPSGGLLAEVPAEGPGGSAPRIPQRAVSQATASPGEPRSFTAAAVTGGTGYRVLVETLPLGTLVVAKPLTGLNDTVHKLAVVELIVTAVALLAVSLLALWLVRVGLHPLTDIERTAGAIAGGDLSQRVPHASEGTEVGRLATALNLMLGQIEAAFAERTLSEQQLRRFAADASHELRTPLTSIRGYAELFRRGAAHEPERLAQAMRRIEEEAARMGVLVDDLLLLARLDQGRPLERRPVDLVGVARDAVADARAVEPDRPLHLDTNGPVTVIGDPARLHQVAANLLANVRAHTPPSTPATVAVRGVNGWAVLEVIDQGPGLEAEHAGRVFERFYRADPARTRGKGGTGLGLSIVAAIAQAHAGRASVRSEPGRGAIFRVELPIRDQPLPPGEEVINLGDDGDERDALS